MCIRDSYNMGFITDNERYNQVIDTWTHVNSDLSDILYKTIKNDDQGDVYKRQPLSNTDISIWLTQLLWMQLRQVN